MNLTIKDIAKLANVSYATVSRALNDSKEISEKTKQKILTICKEVNYSPNAIARGLVKNTTHTIGLIMPDISNPFFPEVALGIEGEAARMDYNVFLCNTNYNIKRELSYINLLLERRVEGIIISSVSDETINYFNKYIDHIPIVYVGSNPKNDKCDYVATDNIKAGYIATDYLIKLGHKKIAFIGGTSVSNSHCDRIKGFKKAFQEHNILPDIELIRNSDFKRKSGYQITKFLIKEKNIPTAIIAANDVVALGVIEACDEMGILIPDTISIIGFDDIPYASLPKIMLTTIAQSKYDLGKIAVETIFKTINNKGKKNTVIKKILDPELIIRKTCKHL
ncbi:MAG: LacI family DNA-binding transcriptional regulator [Clostridiales bacterium]